MNVRIERVLNPGGWREWALDQIALTEKRALCICCSHPLETVARIEGRTQSIRVGCCDRCGYVGYQDVPSEEWIVNFYSTIWNKQIESALTQKPDKVMPDSALMRAIDSIPLDTERPVCEIGCGYGGMLMKLSGRGFKSLVGVENSVERVRISQNGVEARILSGNFEGDAVQGALASRAPFELIYSSHVLEHTSDPQKVIEKASALQTPGDYIVIAVPNVVGEPSMGILFFLPHLHSFTVSALSSLLQHHAYRVVSTAYSSDNEVIIIAQKGIGRIDEAYPTGFFSSVAEKIRRELQLNRMPLLTPSRFVWSKKDSSKTKLKPGREPFFKKLCRKCFGGDTPSERSVLMIKTDASDRYPIVFSFKETPFLFYK